MEFSFFSLSRSTLCQRNAGEWQRPGGVAPYAGGQPAFSVLYDAHDGRGQSTHLNALIIVPASGRCPLRPQAEPPPSPSCRSGVCSACVVPFVVVARA